MGAEAIAGRGLLDGMLEDDDPERRRLACLGLALLGESARPQLETAATDRDASVRAAAERALARLARAPADN